jgi:peroxiredoxin Q/BCP
MTTLHIGDMAPDFTAVADTGETVRLSDFRGQRVVLYFYPKDDTPGCTAQACGFRDRFAVLAAKNTVVLGISPDSVASHQKFKAKYHLPFLLLADENHSIAERYGVWGERKLYGKTFMGIQRSHFVIDETGRIVDIQYKVKPEESVVKALAVLS